MDSYSGVWRAGSGGYYLWVNADQNHFIAKWQELSQQNLRLVDMNIHQVPGNQWRYAGVWQQGTGVEYLWVDADQNHFLAKWQEVNQQNLRLIVLKVNNKGGQLRYSGVWRPGTDGFYLWINADQNHFITKWQELSEQNLRLVDLEILEVNGQLRFSGAWRAGTGGHRLWINADWDHFIAKWQEFAALGLRLTVIKSYFVNGQRRYAGVWRPGTEGYYLWGNTRWENFVAKWRELNDQNLRLIHLDIIDAPSVPTTPWVRLHIKTLTNPNIPPDQMVERMRQVYNSVGVQADIASRETLNLPTSLLDVDVGTCGIMPGVNGSPAVTATAEQIQLFSNRNNVGANELAVYFVRSTNPPSNGCSAHPAGRPGVIVAQGATQWTLAHEVGHNLGLSHVNDNDRLMTGNGTGNITNPPPDVVASEVTTMLNSNLSIDL
jgi:hypothetical protein